MTHTSFENHFLVAMPTLADPYFHKSVNYLCEHNENGAMGIIINQPIELTFKELLGHLEIDINPSLLEATLFNGGPVQQERGFILHTGDKQWETTMNIGENINLTSSKDILADMAANKGPQHTLVALGYAGWDAGQLEEEIAANHWLVVPADYQIIFETKREQQWTAAARRLGIDVNLISNQMGHA